MNMDENEHAIIYNVTLRHTLEQRNCAFNIVTLATQGVG